MQAKSHHHVRVVLAVVVGLFAVFGSGCGSDDSSPSGSSSASSGASTTADAGAGSPDVAAAKAAVDKLLPVPAVSATKQEPVKVPAGKTLGVLNCGAVSPDCREMTAAVQDAAKVAGWKTVVAENGLNAQGWATSMQQLVEKKPDVIVSVIAADIAMPLAMDKAKAAGIPVVCAFCANSFSKPINSPSSSNVDVNVVDQGKAAANYVIAQSGGKAKVAMTGYALANPNVARNAGFKEGLAACSGCKLVDTRDVGTGSDLPSLAFKAVQGILAKYPKGKTDWLFVPGGVFAPGVEKAISLAGRDDIQFLSTDCKKEEVEEIIAGDGAEKACVNSSLLRVSWSAVDAAVRVLAGEKPGNVSLPFQIITKDNAPPLAKVKAAPFTDEIGDEPDYKAYYTKMWGGASR